MILLANFFLREILDSIGSWGCWDERVHSPLKVFKLLLLDRILFAGRQCRVGSYMLVVLMGQLLGRSALWRMELHLKACPRLRSKPLAVDPLVLVGLPQVFQLDQLEARRFESVDISQDAVSVAFGTVHERGPDVIGHQAEYLPDGKSR